LGRLAKNLRILTTEPESPSPSPPEPNNAILRAIDELRTGMRRLEKKSIAISAPTAKTTTLLAKTTSLANAVKSHHLKTTMSIPVTVFTGFLGSGKTTIILCMHCILTQLANINSLSQTTPERLQDMSSQKRIW
jgi:hypothetical protein